MEWCITRCWRQLWVLLHLTACVAGMSGRCSLFGRHHVHTFDGVLYEFPGDCSYLLAGDCNHRSFTLLGDFVHGKRSGVTLFLGDVFELHLSADGRLSQGDKMLSLPYASHAVFVGSELGYSKLWSDEFGFTVTMDTSANIAVILTKHHSNRTCGLCGNFNSVPADEYMAQEGFLTEDSYDFANSWVMKGAGQSCQRVTPPSQTCNATQETSVVLSSCNLLRSSSVFLHCAHLVSAEAFLSLCEEEACHCHDQGSGCHCPVLLEYARSCHAHGVLLHGWLEESQCSPKCPIGMLYSECAKSCSANCQSLNILEVCKEECVDGCTCPVGRVLDGARCVEVSQCSCVHMGRHFPPGSSMSQDCNTCVCRHGSWECTNEGCPGECLVIGQSHFKSFDNKFFTFTGQCQYLLARDCTGTEFSVIIENVQCADDQDAVCTRSVTLSLTSLEDMTVKLKHGGMVSVNGMDIQTPMHHGHLRIQRSVQSSVRVKFGDDLRLDWDGRGRVLLKLGTAWAGRTCGLCGNYNGNHGDDFLSGAGLVEAEPQAFGQSWRINGDCDSTHRPEMDPCAANPKRVRFAEEACSVMMSEVFSPCHFLVNPGPFQKFCRYDVCAGADSEQCLCSALSAYAAACSARGVLLNWRSSSLCELECGGGQVYQACGRACDSTCRSLSGAEAGCRGERACEEGCFCPVGQYLSDSGECVAADRCTCLHDGQLYQPNDVYADHNSICSCENGSMRCSSNEASDTMLSDLFYDDDDTPSRVRRSAPCHPPLERVQCEAGQKGLECARTCQNLDLPCVSSACLPGCLCPQGTVRHQRNCILPEQCPCYHNNKAYASGQSISIDCNTCVCVNRKWRCSERVCDGVCRIVGEGHYITFDGLKYYFPGLCQYVLVQDMCNGEDGSFRVLVGNEACGIVGHRCAKAVTVFYKGGLITMQHGEVKMRRPVHQGVEVEIVRSGQFYILLLEKHISISWDQGTRLLVHISAKYRGRVCGLCGNFDGNVNNDLMSSNNQLEVDSAHFGNSWKVKPSCADVTELPAPCGDNIARLVTVEQSCRVLTGPLFKQCNGQLDAEPYVDMCVEAACSCPSVGDCACFCDVVAAYAQACSERGVFVSWRSNELCPMSCEELNPLAVGEELCQWRYNICGSACPVTCQHPEPLHCPLTCVDGCHANCPPGRLLDEVSMRCVEPSQCQVCVHEGHRISHGKKVILNHEDPQHCSICHCENNTLSCEACTSLDMSSTPTPTPTLSTTGLPFSTAMPEGTCDRAMDLAFLLDGSATLSKEEFQAAKGFVLGVVERFRMGSAHTRATVLLYHSGVKTDGLQVQKWHFKKMVNDLHYAGGDVAFLDEAVKYLAINIYDKNKREHAGRVAIILTASPNPRPMRTTVKMLRKKTITTLTVALGPEASVPQINEITKANPDNRAYVLSSTEELPDQLLGFTDYLCTLGLEPEVPKPTQGRPAATAPAATAPAATAPAATAPAATAPAATAPAVTAPALLEINPIQHLTNTPTPAVSDGLSQVTSSPTAPVKDLTFIVEGSDTVGKDNFNKSLQFLEEVITQLAEEHETIRVTVIQYSVTVSVEIRRWNVRRQKTLLRQRLREMRWRGGSKTNTGAAIASTFHQMVTEKPPGPAPPQLVFLVTENPPTDTVTRPPSTSMHTHIYPIGVGPKVHESDLVPFSFPQRPLMVEDYSQLTSVVRRVVNITRRTFVLRTPTLAPPVLPTLAPLTTLPPTVPCKTPLDVLFLVKAGGQFEDMKTFVAAFVTNADIGPNATQVSVIQYGDSSNTEVSWKEQQSKQHLLDVLENVHSRAPAAPALGAALRSAIQTAISPSSGGRGGVAKAVIMLVTDRSTDEVQEAVNEALTAGVSVFPIGVGPAYDRGELNALGSHGNKDNALHLTSMDQLLMLLTLDHGYTERICRAGPPGVCVDDSGTERKPGESWLLEDGCHTVLCHPNGVVSVQSHKVNCDRLEPPACRNNLPPVKVQEACGCRWDCPCMCMGSSTNHVVRFDGMALRLDGEGACSYTLLTVARGGRAAGSEVKLHSGSCQGLAHRSQVCMKAMEVSHGEKNLQLSDDMTASLDGEVLALPWRRGGLEVVRYGGVMLQVRSDHGYVLAFTPQSNEFTVTLLSPDAGSHTAGLCGACGEEKANDLSLRNGSLATDQQAFISEWTASEEGAVCLPRQKAVCVPGAALACQALHSAAFEPCHAHVPAQPFLAKCEEQACEEADICELISSYAHLCRQRGVCVDWRSPHLCSMQCQASMEYDACRTGCVEDCDSLRALPGDWANTRGNSSCMDTPTEGCFCAGGTVLHRGGCVSPDACSQCVDSHGHAHTYMQSWVPDENPCLICMCLDQQRINCTARPCSDTKPLVCGPCEVLREKRESRCCPEYECVCDLVSCDLPDMPQCKNGQQVVLKNPGECQPIHECVCKQEECALHAPPACPAHRRLSVKKTECCDVHECVCDCQNTTRSCPTGSLTSTSTNDCGCTETRCLPDEVCVVGGLVHPVGSEWKEACQKCSCTQLKDAQTSLHIAQCTPPVCDRTCPLGSSYSPSEGECCGACRKTSCVDSEGEMHGDTHTGGQLRRVGEVWHSSAEKCVLHECMRVNGEVFVSTSNVSCSQMDTPACPLGTELRCDRQDCCPHCYCAPMNACVLNHTIIGAGESLMVDVCTHCQCSVEDGAVKKYRLSCRRIRCPTCPEGYTMEPPEPEGCCGRCTPSACVWQRPDGQVLSVQVNSSREEGCNLYTCGINSKRALVLQTRITTCPPFNRQTCLDQGGKVSRIGTSCCEICAEPECRRTLGTLNYIKVDDCQSEHQIELHYCEGKCRSKSMYSLESATVEQECVCCAAVRTEPLSVPLRCTNGTAMQHTVLSVTACDCLSKRCT